MKRKLLATILCLAISVSRIACRNVDTTEQQEVIATEQTTETEIIETSTEQVEENTSEQVEQVNISEGVDTSTDTSDTSTSTGANEDAEIMQSKWADINGAWDAVHQYELYVQENGADYALGWTWCYDHGKGAGDQPSYAVYMKEGSPDYGKVFHVGDYLPDGNQFSGTNDEWEAFIGEDLKRVYEDAGYEVTEEDGAYVIHLD